MVIDALHTPGAPCTEQEIYSSAILKNEAYNFEAGFPSVVNEPLTRESCQPPGPKGKWGVAQHKVLL